MYWILPVYEIIVGPQAGPPTVAFHKLSFTSDTIQNLPGVNQPSGQPLKKTTQINSNKASFVISSPGHPRGTDPEQL
jgi:hypothetical protein